MNLTHNSVRRLPSFREGAQFGKIIKMDDVNSRYYLRVQVIDQPGVLAKVANLLSENKISISSLVQREGQSKNNVSLLIITHMTVEKNIKSAIEAIGRLAEVRDSVKLIRIEDI